MSLGEILDQAGWRQGSLVKAEDQDAVLCGCNITIHYDHVIVISQSCDIIKNPDEAEPFVEILTARIIDAIDGNKSYNKNPRELHCNLNTGSGRVCVALHQTGKHTIARSLLVDFEPDDTCSLDMSDLSVITRWLAARYRRPAFPNSFNDRLDKARKENALAKAEKKALSRLSPIISGIYLDIDPFRELEEHETYRVNILALVPEEHESVDLSAPDIMEPLERIADVMRKAGMEVQLKVSPETAVPYSLFRNQFKEWSPDSVSLKEDPPHETPL